MKVKFLQLANLTALLFTLCLLAACGGGGGGDSDSPSSSVSGTASKGPIRGGTVNVYAVNADGTRGRLLGTATTSSTDGSYQVNNLGYEGNIVVEVTGGNYVDEATGATRDNPGLKAALASVSGPVKVAVTPLTDIAFRQMSSASGRFSAANIARYNAIVSTAFGVDIVGTQPVDATDEARVANARQGAIDYGVALAAISQMIANGAATDVNDAVERIRADLSATAPRLTSTGTALSQAITDLTSGPTPVLAPTITPSSISVDNSVTFFTTNTVNPPANVSGVAQAKALIGDLRNTILSLVDYNTGEASAILTTPFEATAQEIQTVIEPELAGVADRLAWVVTSISSISELTAGTNYVFTDPLNHPGETLTVTAAPSGSTVTVTVVNPTATLLSGTASVNDVNNPTSGSINIPTMATATGNATATATFNATLSGEIPTSVTLTGNITTPVARFDFSDEGQAQRLSLGFAAHPSDPGSVILTRAYFKGVASSNTARITGAIDLPSLVWNANASPDLDFAIPTSGTVSAKIEALSGGSATLTLNGTLTGAFNNASSFNPNVAESPGNFPNWSASFDGSVVQTGGLNITVLLKANMPAYQTVNFEAKYTRVLADNSTIFLNSTGTSNLATGITTADMTNQNGVQVALSFNDTLPSDQRLTGTMKTSGGETVANFSTVSGVPRVTYTDGYFETLL